MKITEKQQDLPQKITRDKHNQNKEHSITKKPKHNMNNNNHQSKQEQNNNETTTSTEQGLDRNIIKKRQ